MSLLSAGGMLINCSYNWPGKPYTLPLKKKDIQCARLHCVFKLRCLFLPEKWTTLCFFCSTAWKCSMRAGKPPRATWPGFFGSFNHFDWIILTGLHAKTFNTASLCWSTLVYTTYGANALQRYPIARTMSWPTGRENFIVPLMENSLKQDSLKE